MIDWTPVWTTALGGVLATIGGVVSPAIVNWLGNKRSEQLDRRSRRRVVGELLISVIAIRRAVAGDLSNHDPTTGEVPGPKTEEAKREASEIGHRLEMAVQFDAPDSAQLVHAATATVNDLAQKAFEYGSMAFVERHEPLETRAKKQLAWVSQQRGLNDKIDAAVNAALKQLAADKS